LKCGSSENKVILCKIASFPPHIFCVIELTLCTFEFDPAKDVDLKPGKSLDKHSIGSFISNTSIFSPYASIFNTTRLFACGADIFLNILFCSSLNMQMDLISDIEPIYLGGWILFKTRPIPHWTADLAEVGDDEKYKVIILDKVRPKKGQVRVVIMLFVRLLQLQSFFKACLPAPEY